MKCTQLGPAFTMLLAATLFAFGGHASADIVNFSNTTLFDSAGGDGSGGNNPDIFDGDLFATTAEAGFFATDTYVRARGNVAQANLRVAAVVDFDVSAFTAPVESALLEFTAYTLNDTSRISVGQLVGAGGFAPTLINVTSGIDDFSGAQDVINYSIDVTAIVNDWIATGNNDGIHISFDSDTNDGIGIFDGTATQINDGSDTAVFTGADIPDSYKVLSLHVTTDIPEPTSALLLAFGGVALVCRRRK